MAVIIDRTRPSEADKVISLCGEDIARTINIDADWHHIRVGILHEISRSSAANIINPNFAVGLTAGSSSLYGDVSTNHFVGLATPNQTKVYNAGYTPPTYLGTINMITKVATTVTNRATGYNWEVPTISDSSSMYRNIVFVDFIRPLTDPGIMTIRSYTPHAAFLNWNTTGQETNTDFNLWASQLTSSSPQTDINSITFPVSESINGTLDTVNIYWGTVNPCIEISNIVVYRFA